MKTSIRKLSDFVRLTQGINQTRFKKSNSIETIELYDQSSFDSDLSVETEPNDILVAETAKADAMIFAGDVVINTMKQTAAIVNSKNSGKVLSMNFIKVDFKKHELDKRYFVYLFNANKMIARQKDREIQGSAAVLKIPMHAIAQLEIPCLDLEVQKEIGLSYMKMMALKKKYQRLAEANENLTLEILERKTSVLKRGE